MEAAGTRAGLTWGTRAGGRGLLPSLRLLAQWGVCAGGSVACSRGLLAAPDVAHRVSERKTEGQEADGPALRPTALPAAAAGAQAASPAPITA